MKILVVGVFNENSTNNGIANGFENAGHKVMRLNYRIQGDPNLRDQSIIAECFNGNYNLAVFCKCNGVDVRVLSECGIKTFLWYMDPLNGNYNDELIEKIKVADYVGVAKWEVYLKAKELNPNTHFLIEGFDPAWDYIVPYNLYEWDVTFIGSPYGDRARWLLRGVTVLSNKFHTEHAKAVGRSRININFTGGGGISDRVYKILAAGGFCLSQNYPHIERYGLVPDEDLVLFDTPQDMVDKCKYYMQYEDERKAIAKHGHETVQKFSRDNLAKQIVDIVK